MMNGIYGMNAMSGFDQKTYICGIYCRLSKEDGDKEESDSIQHQRDMLVNYCQSQNWQIYGIYQDDGYTGLNQNRPDFQRMLRDIEAHHINLVITKDYSRLGRNHIETNKLAQEYFPKHDVRYIALNDGIDTNHEDDILPVRGLVNELYSKDVSKKVHASYYLQATKGVYTGTVPPFGYLKDPSQRGHLILDPETAPIAKRIFELALTGKGVGHIRGQLEREEFPCLTWWNRQRGIRNHTTKWEKRDPVNGLYVWDESVIKDMLINPAYYGAIASQKKVYRFKVGTIGEKPPEDWIVVENCHEPIVSKQDFLAVQEKLKSRKRSRKTGELSLFAGLLKCGECGGSLCLTYENSKDKPNVYCCKTYNRYGVHRCTRHKIRYDHLYRLVFNEIQGLAKAALQDRDSVLDRLKSEWDSAFTQRNQELQNSIAKAEKRLKTLDRLVSRLYEDLAEERIDDSNFFSVLRKTQQEQDALNSRVKQLREELDGVEHADTNESEWVNLIADYADIQQLTPEVLNRLVKKIVLHEQGDKKRLEIHFNLKNYPEFHQIK